MIIAIKEVSREMKHVIEFDSEIKSNQYFEFNFLKQKDDKLFQSMIELMNQKMDLLNRENM